MLVKECYGLMGEDYEDVKNRLIKDEMIFKFNKKFAQSSDYENLKKALSEKDYDTAFRMVHNLKGMCLNLGYKKLFDVSSVLCEELRNGNPKGDLGLEFQAVTEAYEKILKVIEMMEEPS